MLMFRSNSGPQLIIDLQIKLLSGSHQVILPVRISEGKPIMTQAYHCIESEKTRMKLLIQIGTRDSIKKERLRTTEDKNWCRMVNKKPWKSSQKIIKPTALQSSLQIDHPRLP
jgi:hypothetical protein